MESKYKRIHSGSDHKTSYEDEISNPSSHSLLTDSEENTNLDFDDNRRRQRRRRCIRAIAAHLLIFATYSLAVLGAINWFGYRSGPPQLTYSKKFDQEFSQYSGYHLTAIE
ncbi:hypothetical protein NHQ30_010832 [Ciborinia camelliae]|nr:hypothetical protein NHQ30_010832 [Ciborinia camelliae]